MNQFNESLNICFRVLCCTLTLLNLFLAVWPPRFPRVNRRFENFFREHTWQNKYQKCPDTLCTICGTNIVSASLRKLSHVLPVALHWALLGVTLGYFGPLRTRCFFDFGFMLLLFGTLHPAIGHPILSRPWGLPKHGSGPSERDLGN